MAGDIVTFVTAGAVPEGVLNVDVEMFISGFKFNVVVPFTKKLQRTLAIVPAL